MKRGWRWVAVIVGVLVWGMVPYLVDWLVS